jgi:hypothetical protein
VSAAPPTPENPEEPRRTQKNPEEPSSTSQHIRSNSGVETMSTTQPVGRAAAVPPLRVRDQAREAAALIAFSAATACGLALALLLLTRLGSQG